MGPRAGVAAVVMGWALIGCVHADRPGAHAESDRGDRFAVGERESAAESMFRDAHRVVSSLRGDASEHAIYTELGALRTRLRDFLVTAEPEIPSVGDCRLSRLESRVSAVYILAEVVVEGDLNGRDSEFRFALREQMDKLAAYIGECDLKHAQARVQSEL